MARRRPRQQRGQLQAEFIMANAWLFQDPGRQQRCEPPRAAQQGHAGTITVPDDTTIMSAARTQP